MRQPEKEKIVVLLYKKGTNEVVSYQRIQSKTKDEVKELIKAHNERTDQNATGIYKLLEDCPIADIEKAFCLLPDRTNVEELQEEINDKIDEVISLVNNLEYELKQELKQ